MAITFVNAAKSPTSYPGTNNTSTCTIAKPTSTASGNFMMALINSGGGVVISGPSGWTKETEYDSTNFAGTHTLWWKVAGGSEPSNYTWTDDSGDSTPLNGCILTWDGVDTSAPVNIVGNAESAGTDTKSTPSVTTTQRCLMVHARMGRVASADDTIGTQGTFVAITNYTKRIDPANRGGTVEYFTEVHSLTAGTIVNPGSQSGISYNSNRVLSGSVEWQIGLRDNAPPTNAPATKADVTATAYNAASLTVSTAATQGAATATAYNATAQYGIAAENVPQASATATAYNAMGWVIHPVDIGAVAFNASVATTTNAGYAAAVASLAGGSGYFGAPPARTWRIAAEDRSLSILAESRVYRVEA